MLRDYLNAKGLWGPAEKLPKPPTTTEITLFVEDNRGGPQVDLPRFDWMSTFKSRWNDELAYLLALDFRNTLLQSPSCALFEEDEQYNSLKYIKSKIVSKLGRIRTSYKNYQPPSSSSKENEAEKKSRLSAKKGFQDKMARRLSRRIGVSFLRL